MGINTVIALVASTVTTFCVASVLGKFRLGTVPIQNATLAGGVSIGATANLAMGPGAAALVGTVAGVISCFGFVYPLISTKLDTCGIITYMECQGSLEVSFPQRCLFSL